MNRLLAICLLLFAISCGTGPVAMGGGTASDGEAKIVGRVVNLDGTAIAGARVRLRKADFLRFSDTLPPPDAVTDEQGTFCFDSLFDGSYMIEISGDNGQASVLTCKISEKDRIKQIPPSNLRPTGGLRGRVHLIEEDHASQCRIMIYGLDRFAVTSLVDNAFFFPDLPEGVFKLRIVPNSTRHISVVYDSIAIIGGVTNNLGTLNVYRTAFYNQCDSYACDSAVVFEILTTNNLSRTVEEVTRRSDSRIVSLDVSGLGLASIPASIGKLSALQECNLRGNRLRRLPDEINFLYSLRILDASRNQIQTEGLPAGLGYLEKLDTLDISNNFISALPDLSRLKLKKANLSNNWFYQIPENLNNQSQLRILLLDSNKIFALPSGMAGLQSLEVLSLSDNEGPFFVGRTIEELRNLRYLNLSRIFGGVEIANLLWADTTSRLIHINLSESRIGSLPRSIGNLRDLQALLLANNQLSEIPATLARCTQLDTLQLSGNAMLDQLPEQLTGVKLSYLALDGASVCFPDDSVAAWVEAISPGWRSRQLCP